MIALRRDGKTLRITFSPKKVLNHEINSVPNQHRREDQAEDHLTAKKFSLRTCIPPSEMLILGDVPLRKKKASRNRRANIMMTTAGVFFRVKEATRKETDEKETDTRLSAEIEVERT